MKLRKRKGSAVGGGQNLSVGQQRWDVIGIIEICSAETVSGKTYPGKRRAITSVPMVEVPQTWK